MKVAVTGGTRGIGLATAKHFQTNKAEVWVCGKTKRSSDYKFSVVDLGNPAEIDRWFDEISKAWGSLDVLINNAADIFVASVEKTEPDRFNRLLQVNVTGVLHACRRALPLLRKGKSPTIVNVASISGVFGREKFPGFAAYCASKAAILTMTEVMAREFSKDGIRVNAISPGSVDTEMFRSNVPASVQADMTPTEVAESIFFLATDLSRPMNGKNLELF